MSAQLRTRHWKLSTAESCTGGLIAAECTSLSGSSDWYDRGFVTYSNEAKYEMLGVLPELIQIHGAVSESVAVAMALGAIYRSNAQISVAVTGIAGPTGGNPVKPVGTVWIAWCINGHSTAHLFQFEGERQEIRRLAVEASVKGLVQRLEHFFE
jgi:nicotinamide-nucleotide amidase